MELNRLIDHSLLRPDAAAADIENLCREAVLYRFHSVAVYPIHVSLAADLLKKHDITICSVAGFPSGAHHTDIKIAEALRAGQEGAGEIDLVANIGWLQSGLFHRVAEELSEVRKSLPPVTLLKVIIETPVINPAVLPEAVEAVVQSGAEYVKTATGFFGAATVTHVRLLNEYCRGRIKIKAAGGIRTAADALAMIASGAGRIGCSASVAIMRELQNRPKK